MVPCDSSAATALLRGVLNGSAISGHPLSKLITSMDYRLKGSISLPATLCNAISLTTHLILPCNSPLRTITNKVVSWDSEQEKELRAMEQTCHLALGTQGNGGAGGWQGLGSVISTPGQ